MLKKIQKFFLYLIIVYAIVGFIILPLVLKPQFIKILQTQLNAKVAISSIYVNPFLFKIGIKNLKIDSKKEKKLMSFKSIFLDVDPSSLVYGAFHIHLLDIDKAKINLVRNKDKTINIIKIFNGKKNNNSSKGNDSIKIPRVIVDKISLRDASLSFMDYTVADRYKFNIDKIDFYIENIDTIQNNNPKAKARFYAKFEDNGFVNIHANVKSYRPFALSSNIDFQANKIYTEWKYVKDMLNIEVADGQIYFNSKLSIDTSKIENIRLYNANIYVDNLRLKPKGKYADILKFKKLAFENIIAQPLKKDIKISKILLDNLDVNIKRLKDGSIDWISYLKVKQKDKNSSDIKSNSKDSKLSLNISKIMLSSSNIKFNDQVVKANNSINSIDMTVKNINLKKGSFLDYVFSCKINNKGNIFTKGKLRQAPLFQRGSFKISNISLKEITPYLKESSYLAIEDGFLSSEGNFSYQKNRIKPDLNLNGSLSLKSLFVNNTKNNNLLLSLNLLDVKEYTLELFPNRFYINKIGINSFYIDAKIDKNKTLNFTQLVKVKKSKKIKKTKSKNKFPFKIDKIVFALGSARFQDFSIPLKFKTDIHNLNGVIYSVSNLQDGHTLINLDGEVDKYGSARIKGSLNSLEPKKYTDINIDFKNLNLNSMSGYSAEFAGYKISSGKLFLDLGYKINNSQLKSTNKVVIKKIKLGDEVEDKNVTHLPLKFVTGLLEDDKGVIDIDMPIEGDINKPDFKYGRVVFNVFKNLIMKAVTAPFKFLGSMLGIKSNDLEYLSFETGESKISPIQREKLDRIAAIMEKRPKLTLEIKASYDKNRDMYALQQAKLIDLVLKKSGLKNKKEHQSAMTIDILEDIYKKNVKSKSIDKFKLDVKKEIKEKEFKIKYRQKLIKVCILSMQVTKIELEKLAKDRVDNLILYLTKEKHIQKDRLSIAKGIEVKNALNKLVPLALKLNIK